MLLWVFYKYETVTRVALTVFCLENSPGLPSLTCLICLPSSPEISLFFPKTLIAYFHQF